MTTLKLNGDISLIMGSRNSAFISDFPCSISFQDGYLKLSFIGVSEERKIGYCQHEFVCPIPISNISSFCDFLGQISFFSKDDAQNTFDELLKHFPSIGITKSQQYQISDDLVLESIYICSDVRLNQGDEFISLDHYFLLKNKDLILSRFNYSYQADLSKKFFDFNQLKQALQQLLSADETPFKKKDLTHADPVYRDFAKLAYKDDFARVGK